MLKFLLCYKKLSSRLTLSILVSSEHKCVVYRLQLPGFTTVLFKTSYC